MRQGFFITACIACLICQIGFAQPASRLMQLNKIKLENLQHQILSLKTSISSKQKQRNKVSQQLRHIETIIGGSEKQFKQTLHALGRQTTTLQKTQKKHRHLQTKLNQQQKVLSEYMKAAYMLGRQQYLKMLLNQEDPEKINRFIQYYQYLTAARLKTVQTMKKTLQQLETTTRILAKQAQKLQTTKAIEASQQHRLKRQKASRRYILHKINRSLSNKKARLQQLIANKANLEHVLKNIERRSYYFAPGHLFAAAKAKLPWPVRGGLLIQAFHAPIADGRLYTTGILIKTRAGTPVHAIYKGKVVFANWLRGFGLLTIIQHGKNFMTLYAHAQSLYVKVGDTVNPGEMIATVGNSGGFQQNALYFEIRHDGIALNPTPWLRKRA